MPRRRIRVHYEQLSECERGRIVGLKEAGWANRRITRHMGRSDAAIRRRCWQEWMDSCRFHHHDGRDRQRATADWEDRLIVISAVTAPDSSVSTITRVTRIRVSTITIERRLIKRNLHLYRPLRHLPLMPAHCQACGGARKFSVTPLCHALLQWYLARPGWNQADWGRIVFSDGSRLQLCSDDHRRRVWRRPGQRADPTFTIARHTGHKQGVLVWGAISFDNQTPLVVIRGTLTAQRYVDDILRTVLLPFLLQYLDHILQKKRPDDMRHVLLRTISQPVKHFFGQSDYLIFLQ
ncbi:HTH_Tnp_Tc3_2 domain-containing protein [Trichonephila clavipes]|nr:HTH_Tnp_Tc3_2 domain-containing protein [Trichonephila clavipes]